MADSENAGSNSREASRLRAALRIASFVVTPLVTILALLLCWRQHFVENSIVGSGLALAISVYFAIFLNRRSRGLSARFGVASTGPDREQSSQDQTDIGALWAVALYVVGFAYVVIERW